MTTRLSDTTRAKLRGVSVATLTTALFKRGLRSQFIQDVHPLNPQTVPMALDSRALSTDGRADERRLRRVARGTRSLTTRSKAALARGTTEDTKR